jgi:Zn-dependent protease
MNLIQFNREYLIGLLYSVPALLLAISAHECAHAYVSYKLGDPTSKNLGRISLNPFRHLDIFGTICLILLRFGWAKPVQVNPNNFKNPKVGMLFTSLAGPAMNLILAVLFSFVYAVMFKIAYTAGIDHNIYTIIMTIVSYIVLYNVFLCVFNLIPLPPLDGSKMLATIFPPKLYYYFYKYQRQLYFLLIILIFLGVISKVVNFLGGHLMDFVLKIAFKAVGLL